MGGKYKSDDVEVSGEIDISWPVLFIAIGAAYLASSLTPGIKGPGWLAFGGVYLIVAVVAIVGKRRRRRAICTQCSGTGHNPSECPHDDLAEDA